MNVDSTRKPRRLLRGILIAVAAIILVPLIAGAAFLLIARPPVDDFRPEAWTPRDGFAVAPELVSTIEPEAGAESFFGPEDIAVDAEGAVYTGARDGIVWRTAADGTSSAFADVGGRPLGMMFDAAGNLLIANHGKGLQSVTPDGEVTVLADHADGTKILFANDLDVSDDGIVYLTDSSARYNTTTLGSQSPSYLLPDFIDGRATGRVIAYDLATGEVSVLLDGMYFPNGIALTEDGGRLWIAESNRYRITQVSLDTPGDPTVLIDDLPGTPDNINRDADGSMLVALYDRVAALDRLVLPTALAREFLIRLPGSLFVNEENPLTGSVLVFDDAGELRSQHTGLDPAATAVVPSGDRWYFGALLGQPIRWIERPDTEMRR